MRAEELLKMKILEPAMGAAAFQNEVINQVAELYLTFRQKELGKKIPPQNYQDELQKTKAYIATKNIYGVDLNPTAIELGKLALWLNVMHKDMETPFFAHRLALGNAVIGAWFKAYDVDELYKKERTRYVCTNWWEKAPHRLHFSKERRKIIRKTNEIYHFLVPDKNMLAALKITEEKNAHPEIARGMQNKVRDWTKPLTAEDILVLKKISSKIDRLISEYISFQEKIEKLTANNYRVWEAHTYYNSALFRYDDKENLAKTRNAKNNAYHKLVTVMNYWCSLWFWEYEDADKLPSREEYWADIDNILGIDFTTGKIKDDDKLVLTSPDQEEPNLFSQPAEFAKVSPAKEEEQTEDAEELINPDDVTYTKEDAQKLFSGASSSGDIFENARTPIVEKLADRYHFFHPMLEFIEVFWLRDGFDVIVGNPPWIKLEFDESSVISEVHPEVSIRRLSGPEVHALRDSLFENNLYLKTIYYSELEEFTCTGQFLSSYSCYPLLVGQQNNLYKSILENGFNQLASSGFMGLIHPEGVYDDPNGGPLRKEIYPRLRYHFQFKNELRLFEIGHTRTYGCHIYSSRQNEVNFVSIHNLFTPLTIDGCFTHDGSGQCLGIKANGKWNCDSHKERVVRITDNELKVLALAFEDNSDWQSCRLISIHSTRGLSIIEKLSKSAHHVSEYKTLISEGLHEKTSVNDGTMEKIREQTSYEEYQMILCGPHLYVSNPLNGTPSQSSRIYDTINPMLLSPDYSPVSNFRRKTSVIDFVDYISGFEDSQQKWIDYYKLGFRKMVDPGMERTLIGAILPPHCSHVGGIISIVFSDLSLLVEFCALTSSLVLDFFMKSIGASNLSSTRLLSFPIKVQEKYSRSLRSRALLLNCLTKYYQPLWDKVWEDSFNNDTWSIMDSRLKRFDSLSSTWSLSTPLRNYYERRMALVEIDVISAMSLGLALDDLISLYLIQFPVLQQNEHDTWYDQHGEIVFTVNKGLGGIGVDRNKWEEIRNQQAGETYTHTIDPAKSELYGGQQVTYYAPYTKCDRIEDYRRAWAHFEKVFNEKE